MTPSNTHALIEEGLAGASTTREIVVGREVLPTVGSLVSGRYPNRIPVIVADECTFEIAGQEVLQSLKAAGMTVGDSIIFAAKPTLKPDMDYIAKIRAGFGSDTLPIAVGSGTINDLTKRAAFESGLPYMVVATAPSMDGYTASGAALVSDGVKQTFECPAPEVVVADLDILRQAPAAMIASGYGDLVGKVTAGADWLLADALGIEPLIPDVWEMVQGPLRGMIDSPQRLFNRDEASIEQLFQGLVITGLAIQTAGTTRTASGSEHQFSHLWEMRGLEFQGETVSHGKKVALGTIVSETLYQQLLGYPVEELNIDEAVAAWPDWAEMENIIRATHDHPMLMQKALEECQAKYISADELRDRLTLFKQVWPELRNRLADQLLPLDELQQKLTEAQCPTRPEDIGLDMTQMRESYLAAGQIRRRYTVYDLLLEAGLLQKFVDEIFGSNGYWSMTEKEEIS